MVYEAPIKTSRTDASNARFQLPSLSSAWLLLYTQSITNSITPICCCGFIEQQVVQQVHNICMGEGSLVRISGWPYCVYI